MESTGKIIKVYETRSGVSKSSGKSWASQEAVMEIPGKYTTHMLFTIFGEDRIKAANLREGMDVKVQFDIDAHEYNGRWYNEVHSYNIAVLQPSATQQPAIQQPEQYAPPTSQSSFFDDSQQDNDHLPF